MIVADELIVSMGGRRVGVLDGSDRRNLRFTYDDAWAADAATTPLSVSMPLGVPVHTGRVVDPYLWGLLPDNERVLTRWATDYQCSATNVFALLSNVGTDVAGAAQYLPAGASGTDVSPGRLEPLAEQDVEALLREVREDSTAWHATRHAGRWSLAGAQGKVALAFDATTGGWAVPSGSIPTTHILKPAIAGLADHDVNEHLCLAAAAGLGLHAAETSIARFGAERALVIRRYDRVTSAAGTVQRVHQEDCCQALSVHPSRKYQNEGGPGIGDLATLLRTVVPGDAARDVDALVRATAFNWLVLGTDAHAKNYSLLLSGAQVRLAPLYDIASAAPYDTHPRKLRMAQKVGGEYRPTVITTRHWDRLAREVQVDPDRLGAELDSMIGALPDALADAIAASDLTPAESTGAARLLDGITDWLAHCRRALRSAPR